MPRLVPRLVKALTSTEKNSLARPSPHRISSPIPTANVSPKLEQLERPFRPDFVTKRDRSILLDPVNPILHPKEYRPLKHGVKKRSWDTLFKPAVFESDLSRLVHEEDTRQKANPYLSMLASSLRRCLVTSSTMPADFLLRLGTASVRDEKGATKVYLLPDGLEHPKFKSKTAQRGSYVLLWKETLDELVQKGGYKRLGKNVEAHALLSEQVHHQLQQRVLQELELLHDRLRALPKLIRDRPENRIVRPLTDEEVSSVLSDGLIPKDTHTVAMIGFMGPDDASSRCLEERAVSKVFTITPHPPNQRLADPLDTLLPPLSVPLYHAENLFPSTNLNLRQWFEKLSDLQSYQKTTETSNKEPIATKEGVLSDPASIIFLLRNPHQLVECGINTAPLAIALWRMRLWNGAGWTI